MLAVDKLMAQTTILFSGIAVFDFFETTLSNNYDKTRFNLLVTLQYA
jgi:hypothetical protein